MSASTSASTGLPRHCRVCVRSQRAPQQAGAGEARAVGVMAGEAVVGGGGGGGGGGGTGGASGSGGGGGGSGGGGGRGGGGGGGGGGRGRRQGRWWSWWRRRWWSWRLWHWPEHAAPSVLPGAS
ncbi:unnamed protein product [Closterium sp. NIES-64]|nr:unnamed protein product [Closterium sp. NIES-64]